MLSLFLAIDSWSQLVSGIVYYNYKETEEKRKMLLTFSDSQSLCTYNKYGFDDDEVARNGFGADFDKDKLSGIQLNIKEYDSIGKIVFRDFRTKEIIYREPKFGRLPPLLVRDNWVTFNWVISDKKRRKKIMGYSCRKATANFRGRKYTAWFADSINVPYGPWKLFGLPGLILYAHDEDKEFVFEAYKIELNKDVLTIQFPMADSVISIEEYVDYKDNRRWLFFKDFESKLDEYNKNIGRKAMWVENYKEDISNLEYRKAMIERKYEFEQDGYRFNKRPRPWKGKEEKVVEHYNFDRK